MGATEAEFTDQEITDTFKLLKEHSSPVVYAVLEKLEAIVRLDRLERITRRMAVGELNEILAWDMGEPPTTVEETERAGIDLSVPSVVANGRVLTDRLANGNPDLIRDARRGK